MWAECLAIAVKMIMNNHIYIFDNQMRIQEGNGSIGVRATGQIGEIQMSRWDKKFSIPLKKLTIESDLQVRFVDDETVVLPVVDVGIEYKDGQLVYNPDKVENNKLEEEDKRSMDTIERVANSIDPQIQIT